MLTWRRSGETRVNGARLSVLTATLGCLVCSVEDGLTLIEPNSETNLSLHTAGGVRGLGRAECISWDHWLLSRAPNGQETDQLTVCSVMALKGKLRPSANGHIPVTRVPLGGGSAAALWSDGQRFSSMIEVSGGVLVLDGGKVGDLETVVRLIHIRPELEAPWVPELVGLQAEGARLPGSDWLFDTRASTQPNIAVAVSARGQVVLLRVRDNGGVEVHGPKQLDLAGGRILGAAADANLSVVVHCRRTDEDALFLITFVGPPQRITMNEGRHVRAVAPLVRDGALVVGVRFDGARQVVRPLELNLVGAGGHLPTMLKELGSGRHGLIGEDDHQGLVVDSPYGWGRLEFGGHLPDKIVAVAIDWPHVWVVSREAANTFNVRRFAPELH